MMNTRSFLQLHQAFLSTICDATLSKKMKTSIALVILGAMALSVIAEGNDACSSYNSQAVAKRMPLFDKFNSIDAANTYSVGLKNSFSIIAKGIRKKIDVRKENEKYWEDFVEKFNSAIPSGKELMALDSIICQGNLELLDIRLNPKLEKFFDRVDKVNSAQMYFENKTGLHMELEKEFVLQVGGNENYVWDALLGKERSAILFSHKPYFGH